MLRTMEATFLATYESLDADSVPYGPAGNRESVRGSPVVPNSAWSVHAPLLCFNRFLLRFTARVPPACSRLLEDKEGYVLYTVLILKKFKESFVNDARNKKFPVREFVYHPEAAGSGIAKLHKMEHEVQEALVRTTPLYRLPLLNQFTCTELLCLQSHLQEQCARKFGDSMSIWMHLKVQQLVCFSFFVIESPCHALRCRRARPFVCLWKQYCATVYPSILCVR